MAKKREVDLGVRVLSYLHLFLGALFLLDGILLILADALHIHGLSLPANAISVGILTGLLIVVLGAGEVVVSYGLPDGAYWAWTMAVLLDIVFTLLFLAAAILSYPNTEQWVGSLVLAALAGIALLAAFVMKDDFKRGYVRLT